MIMLRLLNDADADDTDVHVDNDDADAEDTDMAADDVMM